MAKRNYKLQDVYDYLKEYYNLDWKLCQIISLNDQHGVRQWNFDGKEGIELCVIAIVYMGEKQKHIRLRVTNDEFEIYEINSHLHYYKSPKVQWKDYLAQRHNQGLSL